MKKILIVDDNKNNRLFLNALLDDFLEEHTDITFEISEAKNGKEAVQAASSTPFDLILMDIMMPEMDGIEATGIIRANDKNVMIIAVSAADDEERKKQILNNGAEDYIAKPVNADIFQTRLLNYLSLIEARNHKHFSSRAHNLYTSEIFSRQLTFFIESEDCLSEFWEYYLLSESIKSDLLSDVVRTVAAIAEYFVRLEVPTTIVAEESADMIYLTIDNIHELDKKLIELTMMKNSAVTEYKQGEGRISFVVEKPDEVYLAVEPAVAAPEPDPAKEEPKEVAPSAPVEVNFAKSSDRELEVYDYMDLDDLEEIENYIGRLDSLLLLVGSGEISVDEVVEIYTYIERIGRMMTTYPETYEMGQALIGLAGEISAHLEEFRASSSGLGPLCAAFSRDMSKWVKMTFSDGSPSVDFMDDTIIANAGTISGMLTMNNAADDDAGLDDIFDF